MKYTGWAVLIIGVLIGVYGLFTMLSTTPTQVPASESAPMPLPFGGILLGFAALAVGAGITLLLYGRNGVIKTKNLAVRN